MNPVQGGNWHCLHIDDLRATERPLPPITLLQSQTPAQLLMAAVPQTRPEHPLTASSQQPQDLMQWEEGEQPQAAGGGDPEEVRVAGCRRSCPFCRIFFNVQLDFCIKIRQ